MRGDLLALQRDIAQQTRTLFVSLTGVLLTLAGLALAASRLG